jgi:hypothetical protein
MRSGAIRLCKIAHIEIFRRGPADAERALAMPGLVLIRLKLAKMEALLGRMASIDRGASVTT